MSKEKLLTGCSDMINCSNKLTLEKILSKYQLDKYVAIFSIILVIVFLIATPFSHDDVEYFVNQHVSLNWLIHDRYLSWSHRIIIESILPFLVQHPYVFKFCNVVILLVAYIGLRMIYKKYNVNWIILFFTLCLFPYYAFSSAGIAATLVNYYYPICISFLVLGVTYNNDNYNAFNRILLFVLVLLLTLFCTNHEQLAACLFAIYVFFYREFKNQKLTCAVIIISLTSLVFCLISPGNHLRLQQSILSFMPEFSSYSIFQKIYLGLSSGLYTLTFTDCMPFTLCLISLVFAKFRKYRYILFTLIAEYIVLKLVVKTTIKSSFLKFDGSFISMFPVSVFCILVFFALILFVLTFILEIDLKQKIGISFFILLSFVIKFLAGFSPTVFASQERTALFSEIMMIMISLFILFSSKVNKSQISLIMCLFVLYTDVRHMLPIVFGYFL